MNDAISSRLRWSCRRGMLELDVLLGYFLEEAYPFLHPDEQIGFTQLLEENDQDLFLWLTGKEVPPPYVVKMVEMVRLHAINRHST